MRNTNSIVTRNRVIRPLVRRAGWVLLGIIAALTLSMVADIPSRMGTPEAQAATDVGYRDFSFSAPEVSAPTGEKPQSKLWFNDGTWWGSLFDRSTEQYRIYRYDWSTHTWSDTGTLIDERNSSKADTLWDGTHLYVASAGPSSTNSADSGRILRYSYDAATKSYSLDPGFPVTVTNGGMEAITLDKDTTGKLWVTFTQGSKVYANHSLENDSSWGTPFVLPVQGTDVSPDDISAVTSFDLQTSAPQIGVMWSNEVDDKIYFATHKDGDSDSTWQQTKTAIQGPKSADDHINLKSLQSDASGRVFAAVKTSLNDPINASPNAPQIFLTVLGQDGNFTNYVFGRVGDHHTRPIVMIDQEHRDLYMFATAPFPGGTIYYKKTSLNNISFPNGKGTPFIQSATDLYLNNATSTKQSLNSSTGLLVMASDSTSGYYMHNTIDLSTVDDTPPTVRPPAQDFVAGSALGTSAVPVKIAWSATDGSGISSYQLQQSTDGGAYTDVTLPTLTTTTKSFSLAPGSTYQFRVRATDGAANTSDWSYGTQFVVDAQQESSAALTYAGFWTQESVASAYGGGLKYATETGAKTTFGFTGYNVAWVAPKDVDRGKAEVWLDGSKAATVDLYSSSAKPRRIVFSKTFPSSSNHTLEVRLLGTRNLSSNGTRVDADAFLTLR